MKKWIFTLCILVLLTLGALPVVHAQEQPLPDTSDTFDDTSNVPEDTSDTSGDNSDVSGEPEEPEEFDHEGIVSLDGKTVMIVGNSMVYYGNCVVLGDTGKADYGYFYQLAAANNENVTVIDHTYPGEKLNFIYDNFLVKLSQEERDKVDYLVLSEGNQVNEDLVGTCEKILALFPEDTQFRFLRQPMMFESDMPSLIKGVEALRNKGYDVVDWGKLVYDIHSGAVQVPGATLDFKRTTFMKENKGYKNGTTTVLSPGIRGDRNHQNPLSGYITAQMLYTSLTNRSAVLTDYSFCYDTSISPFFNIDVFAKDHYTGPDKTNFPAIFRSPQDMLGVQQLIDLYLQKEGWHPLAVQEAIAPTCTRGGLTHGSYCPLCQETVETQEVIPADKGAHDLVFTKGVLPTCTKDGTNPGTHCSVCHQVFQQATTLPATGHRTKVQHVRATTKVDGYKKTTCTTCGETLSHQTYPRIQSAVLSQTDFIYNGLEQKSAVTITDTAGNTLKEGVDYTLAYSSGRIEVKNYKITVTYIGNYKGSAELVYQIRADKVTDFAATGYLKTVKLTWKPANKATHYRIYKYDTASKSYKKVADTTKTSYKVTGLKTGTQYDFQIRAYTRVGDRTYYSPKYEYVTAVTRPARVVMSTATSKKKGNASLSWEKRNADGYEITYSVYKAFSLVRKVTVTGNTKLSTTVKNLTSGKRYYVKVRAYKLINGQKVYGYYSKVKQVRIK